MTQTFSKGEPKLVHEPIEITSDTSLSLPEILSLLSTPSTTGQTRTTTFPTNFPINLNDRYRELRSTNIPFRLDSNTFVASPPLFEQCLDSNRLHNWVSKKLHFRHNIHKDIQEHNNQILTQIILTLKFEITVKLSNLVHHPLQQIPPTITAQSLPPLFITTELIYKYNRYTKKTIGYITFYNPFSELSYTCIF